MLILFIAFILYQLRKGQNLIDILKLRRDLPAEPQHDRLLEEDEAAAFGSSAFIFKSQRFSIRSSHYTASLHGNRSKRVSQASQSPYRQYSETYFLSAPTNARPVQGHRPRQTPPIPPLQTDLDTLPKLSIISRPEMVHVKDKSPLSASDVSTAFHGVAEEVAVNKASPRHLTITTKPVDGSPMSPASRQCVRVQPGRHSIIHGFRNSRILPPHELDNTEFDTPIGSQLDNVQSPSTMYTAMDVIDENKATSVYELSATPATPVSPVKPPLRSSMVDTLRRLTRSDLQADIERGGPK